MIILDICDGDEIIETITKRLADRDIPNAVVVGMIGAVDQYTLSTMRADNASRDELGVYHAPGEIVGFGGFVTQGEVHLHLSVAIEGGRTVGGHLLYADVTTHFVKVALEPIAEAS